VDDEVARNRFAARRFAADARIAFGGEPLGVVLERAAHEQRPSEPSGIESLERTRDALVGLDAAAAVHRATGVGMFQVARAVRSVRILILQAVAQVLIEARVPGPLNEPPAGGGV